MEIFVLPPEVRATIWRKLRWLSSADTVAFHLKHRTRPRLVVGTVRRVALCITDKKRLQLADHREYGNFWLVWTNTDYDRVRVDIHVGTFTVKVYLWHFTSDLGQCVDCC